MWQQVDSKLFREIPPQSPLSEDTGQSCPSIIASEKSSKHVPYMHSELDKNSNPRNSVRQLGDLRHISETYTLKPMVSLPGPIYRPPNTIILIIGTPKMVPPNFGKP